MELTQQHFDQVVKTLVTKEDIKKLATHQQIINLGDQIDELARMTKGGFDDVLERLDVRERVEKLEKDFKEMKIALHIS